MVVAPGTVIDALKHRYIKSEGAVANADKEQLIQSLRDMPEDRLSGKPDLLKLVAETSQDSVFGDAELATVQSADDCISLISNLIDVDQQINDQLQLVMPELACQLLENSNLPLEKQEYSILAVLDLLVSAGVGWSSDLCRAGDKLISEVSNIVASIRSEPGDFKEQQESLQAFL